MNEEDFENGYGPKKMFIDVILTFIGCGVLMFVILYISKTLNGQAN